jgi:lathosterol oxidase
MAIYWIHRWLHEYNWLYKNIHKPHHRWIVSTPFASHAFHPADGFSQSMPYHIFVFLFPLNKTLYLVLFVFVNFWTISIHDQAGFAWGEILNGADHHTIHHRDFLYNYGQYFTLWDKLCGTHRLPESLKKPKSA